MKNIYPGIRNASIAKRFDVSPRELLRWLYCNLPITQKLELFWEKMVRGLLQNCFVGKKPF